MPGAVSIGLSSFESDLLDETLLGKEKNPKSERHLCQVNEYNTALFKKSILRPF